uniref:Thiamine pyrophosphate enzyme-like TPP binding region n=1 Tax=mine drainage metagenome TaxID=410659 RepID=E6PD89_9ZZZZ
MKMKVADFIASFIADKGVRHVFMLTGGGAMHLNDAFGFEPRLTSICTHHEQAASIAAEGYARVSGEAAVVNVTTGPGGINALNGVFGAWTDSIPMIVISGQVRRSTILSLNPVSGLRQLGDQEVDIVSMVKNITKYSTLLTEPESVKYHLEKAYSLATSGRPGPVWIDVPIDVQGAFVDCDSLTGFDAEAQKVSYDALRAGCKETLKRISAATRPVLLIGSGVRASGALPVFERVIKKIGIPVTPAWTAIDAIAFDDPLYAGRPGTLGDRAGNFVVQNADVLIAVGCRLALRQVSYNWDCFARGAYKIIVDIDPAELKKPMVHPDYAIEADARAFFEELERQIDDVGCDNQAHSGWLGWCRERLEMYPVVQPKQRVIKGERINPYHFLDKLFDYLTEDDVVVCGDASASVITFQVARNKRGQRIFTNAGCASMGYDLPAAVGAAVARNGKRVICIAGDGSLQLNIQELQTIAHHSLPVKLVVLNNGGYLSMRSTQGNFFKRFIGEGPQSGVSFPDVTKIGDAYGFPTFRISGENFESQIARALGYDGPVVCDIMIDLDQGFEPKLTSRQLSDGRIVTAALEDMAPFLPPDEMKKNMFIPPFE